MNLNNLRQLVQEEMSRFEFMKHLAGKRPDLNAKQIGEIYKLYKGGMDINVAVAKVAPMQEQEGELGGEISAAPKEELRKKAIAMLQDTSGIMANETEIFEFIINLVELAKSENVATSSMQTALERLKTVIDREY
tara:strand:+ start:206 stop:610 length:405 start_codon:yes stop_codon:yes gene_type:complete